MAEWDSSLISCRCFVPDSIVDFIMPVHFDEVGKVRLPTPVHCILKSRWICPTSGWRIRRIVNVVFSIHMRNQGSLLWIYHGQHSCNKGKTCNKDGRCMNWIRCVRFGGKIHMNLRTIMHEPPAPLHMGHIHECFAVHGALEEYFMFRRGYRD